MSRVLFSQEDAMNEHNRGAPSRVVSKPAQPYLSPNARQGMRVLRQSSSHGLPRPVILEKVKVTIRQLRSSVATPANALGKFLQSPASVTSKPSNAQPASSVGRVTSVGDGPRAEPATLVVPRQSPLPSVPGATINTTRETPKSSKADPCGSGPIAAVMTRAIEGTQALVGSKALLTEKDVAATLGLKPATLRNWRVRGEGPRFVRLSRRAIRYRRADVDEWVASRARRSTSATEVNHG
jgi:predicted DNA-binding transcriptional regulator AlpA